DQATRLVPGWSGARRVGRAAGPPAPATSDDVAMTAPVVDVDAHVYETEVIWEDYVPDGYKPLARAALWHGFDDDGNRLTIRNGVPVRELGRSALAREAIWRPGMMPRDIGALDPHAFHAPNPG